MSWLQRIFSKPVETRSQPTTWDLMKAGADYSTDAGVPVSPHLAENLATVFACVQVISETVAMLPLHVYRKLPNGGREEVPDHPIARIFSGDANDHQMACELLEMMTAHTLLRGWAPAEIVFDGRGAPVEIRPYHPDWVSLVRISSTNRYTYDISMPTGGTRRLLPEEMLILRDRTDDGITPKSRLTRAREAFGGALAAERFANSVFRNGAQLSGVLQAKGNLSHDSANRLKETFNQAFTGARNAAAVAVLEEGLEWKALSVSPDDAQMLESRRFSTMALCRIFRVPPPVIGEFEGGNYSSISEVGRWFYSHTIQPWLNRWERSLERSLLSEANRRQYEVEFDCDLLLRGDMLSRFQSYRIAREIGLYNANELRRFEHANPRTDAEAETYFAPANMQQEQTGRPIADRGAEE
jgi:HK97 family phage portal protein